MRLELGSFPVRTISFGPATRWDAGHLTVDRAAALAEVRRDPRIVTADLELAAPGDSVRIWPVRDVIEPRIKVEGPGQCYPGICGRDIATVGAGTHASAVRDGRGRGLERQLARRRRRLRRDLPRHGRSLRRDVSLPPPAAPLRGGRARPRAVRREPQRRRPQGGADRERSRGARHRGPHAARARDVRADAMRPGAAARGLYLGRALAAGHVGLAHRLLHGDLRAHPAHAAVDAPPQRDHRRSAHRPLPHGLRHVVDGGQ